jgi:hypothetical protein
MQEMFITMAPNYWGKGSTAIESIKNCRKVYGAGMKDYDVYKAHPETTIDGMGGFSYPTGPEEDRFAHRPVMIDRVRKGKHLPVDNA